MNKDLDFIRDKLSGSEIKAPEDMGKGFALELLNEESAAPETRADDAQSRNIQNNGKRKMSRTKRRVIAAAAAFVVLAGALSVALSSYFSNKTNVLTLPGGLALEQFRSADQIKNRVKVIRMKRAASNIGEYIEDLRDGMKYAAVDYAAENNRSSGAMDSYSAVSVSAASGSSNEAAHSDTYKQVQGVDEADIIKTDGRYIYCVDGSSGGRSIVVFSADGEASQRVAEIDIGGGLDSTADQTDTYYISKSPSIQEIYLKDGRLIAICGDLTDRSGITAELTKVLVYNVEDIEHITLVDTMTQSGDYGSSRMIGDTLYTVSSYCAYEDYIMPVCGGGNSPDEVPADCVYCLCEPEEESFLVMSAYDTLDYTAQTESKAILGYVDDVYCNLENMYIYSTIWNSDAGYKDSLYSSQILKVDLSDGIEFTAYGKIDGRINNQYSLDEKDGMLRVTTTTRYNWTTANSIFVLDEELKVLGKLTDFARGEELKATRFIGDTAYVITFRQTDPLFVIDLSEPTYPKILGEVEITGFSSMLVPIDENTILGLGYHTDENGTRTESGFKLALFDVSDKTHPKVLDSKSYIDCSSPVMSDPKALVYNPERGDFVIPLNYYQEGYYDFEIGYYIDSGDVHGGMLNFKVEDGKLVETDFYEADYQATDRCVFAGDTIYMTYYDNGKVLCIDTTEYK